MYQSTPSNEQLSGPDPKLDELTEDDGFRAKISAILAEIGSHGYADVYIANAMSSVRHDGGVETGCMNTPDSSHSKLGSDGKCLAADVVPRSNGWNTSKRFWMLLGWLCHIHEVGWGGLFGLTTTHAKELLAAMERLSAKGWPTEHDPDYGVATGWEAAHCQKEIYWPV